MKKRTKEVEIRLTKSWLNDIPASEGHVTQLEPPLEITGGMVISGPRLDEICIVREETDEDAG